MAVTKNIVISGTNFWNPGDDFVRDGVIKILHELFPGEVLNFLFYNFNEDFFPQSKFKGIHNMAAKGDLEQYKDFIDYIVIAGLSAGKEIKDLYSWIIENNLTDRVFLIGAGYENNYAAKHITEEPELTIFKNAKVITGRTRKTPDFITQNNLPYHYINCPAILSVPEVKEYPEGKKIKRIAFSIQLPKEIGVSNHHCAKEMYLLAIELIPELYSDYEIEFVAHHKSEYFHFLELFKEYNINIPVIFSSYYQDLYELYKRYDLIITTRLHASLFANGHGIPGIILNDTDRHTHCLEGFPHSVWVNSYEKFYDEFEKIKKRNLADIAREAKEFKTNLLQRYVEVLKAPFYSSANARPAELVSQETLNEKIASFIQKGASSLEVKKRVLANFEKLTQDYWLGKNIEGYKAVIERKSTEHYDLVSFLNWYSYLFKPESYFEIGVRRGRSMCQVVSSSPDTKIIGMDLWIKDYSTIPEKGIFTENPGPEFVQSELDKFGVNNKPRFIKGDTRIELAKYFADKNNPQEFDLIVVDGDHTYNGAKSDLTQTFEHLKDGGVLVFDDITHPSHAELRDLWEEFKVLKKEFVFVEDLAGTGTGVAIKPPFAKFINVNNSPIKESLKKDNNLPVHFFTIVLNGKPFIEYHINVFKNLPFNWHWHIVEGVADLKNDTAWSLKNGAKITNELHKNGLSNDGTTEYLNKIKEEYPDNITIYRKENGTFWNGKLEMVNAPLANIKDECVLWQIDADELWTAEQFTTGRQLYLNNPEKTASYYFCAFYVGEKLIITSTDTYGNHTKFEWIRSWHYLPGDQWISHEPPTLSRKNEEGRWVNLAKINPYMHEVTQQHALVFQHFAYVTPEQLKFKENYYGYANAVEQWKRLQVQELFPQKLADYFSWVKDEAVVSPVNQFGIIPLAVKENSGWEFNYTAAKSTEVKKILFLRTDAIGDCLLAASLPRYLKKKYSDCTIDVVCQSHTAPVFKNSDYINRVITINKKELKNNEAALTSFVNLIRAEQYDLVLNTIYSSDNITDVLAVKSGAKEIIGFNGETSNISAEQLKLNKQYYTRIIHAEAGIHELRKYEIFLDALDIEHDELKPEVLIDNKSAEYAEELFKTHNLNSKTTVALAPFALHHHKEYDKYNEVVKNFPDYTFVLFGGKEKEEKEQISLYSENVNCINLVGKTELIQMAAIIAKCRLYVGADSSAAHIACALDVPNIVITGGAHYGRFMPYSKTTVAVSKPMECYGCNWRCTQPSVKCIKEINSALIIKAFNYILENKPDKPVIFAETGDKKILNYLTKDIDANKFKIIISDIIPELTAIEEMIAAGNYDEANSYLVQLVKDNPYNFDALNDLAVVQSCLGNNEIAAKILSNILVLDPENSVAKENSEVLSGIKA